MARKRSNRLEVIHPDCAGIDIGKSKHYVARRARVRLDAAIDVPNL